MRIGILHLDLGLGGAERQTIDEALALKEAGHEVTIITTHHTSTQCFPETIDPKLLGDCIEVYGDWIPRHIFGLFHALMSIFRMFWASLRVIWSNREFDIIFLDQVSYVIPLFQLSPHCKKVVFYCHHPDLLLSSRKDISFFKKLYRVVLDWFEQITTASCDELLVNSKYTQSIVLDTFPMIKKLEYLQPRVVYPAIDTNQFQRVKSYNIDKQRRITFLSINRYERKKNIELAIKGLNKLYKQLKLLSKSKNYQNKSINYFKGKIKLIIAGGYDERLAENREYLNELVDLCKKLDLKYQFITQTAFEQRPSVKYSKEDKDNNNDNDDNDNSDDEDINEDNKVDDSMSGSTVKRRQSVTEKVAGLISSAITASYSGGGGGGSDDTDDDSSSSSSSSDDDDDDDADMGDDEYEHKKNHKRRESSRRSTIDFLDNSKLKIDKNANVYFITKFPESQKLQLLQECIAVCYTPQNEHFGIVPLEAMLAGRPIIACDSGGPLETVQNNETGFLCEPTEDAWCHAMKQFIDNDKLSGTMGKKGRKRVLSTFSRNALIKEMDQITKDVMGKKYQMPLMIRIQTWFVVMLLFVTFVPCAPALFVMSRL